MTVAKLSVEPQGDVVFEFTDSCNCCCWSWKKKPNTPLYINSRGEAVKFNFQKSVDLTRSMEKSLNNLKRQVIQLAESREKDREVVLKHLSEMLEDANSHITRKTLENINELFDRLVD